MEREAQGQDVKYKFFHKDLQDIPLFPRTLTRPFLAIETALVPLERAGTLSSFTLLELSMGAFCF